MDFMQHIPSEVLRVFLRDELPAPQTDVIRLHLSFCPICQEKTDELLIEDVIPQVVVAFEHPTIPRDGHVEERLLEQFWEGKINEESQVERISDHCLACRVCRDKRYEVWLNLRKESLLMKVAAAVGLRVLPELAVRARRHRNTSARRRARRTIIPLLVLVPLAGVLITLKYMGRGDRAPMSSKVQEQKGAAPAALPSPESLQSGTPVDTPTAPSDSSITKAGDGVTSVRLRNDQRQLRQQPSRVEHVYEASEQVDRVQVLNLSDLTADLNVRGTKKEEGATKPPLIIPSRIGDTHLRIELPENSRKGRYIVSIQDPARLDSSLDEDEDESSDGRQISVALDFRGLSEKEYQLTLMRENEESGDKEFLGYVSVRVLGPSEKDGRR